jgi:hypothetical protein
MRGAETSLSPYHAYGDAPIDLIFITGFVSNIPYGLENPLIRRLYERISRFARLSRRRGPGSRATDRGGEGAECSLA